MRKPARAELLEHYGQKPVTHFVQYDGFANVPEDDIMHLDEDGHTIFAGHTYSLVTPTN